MEKIESKYDLYQWIQVTMAIRRLKAGISEQIGMLQSTLEAGLGITHIVEKLKEQSEDMIALTVQKNFMDDEMSAELNKKESTSTDSYRKKCCQQLTNPWTESYGSVGDIRAEKKDLSKS